MLACCYLIVKLARPAFVPGPVSKKLFGGNMLEPQDEGIALLAYSTLFK